MGMQKEFAAGIQAVDATKDEVLSDKNGLISPVFSSNSGGMTADPSEVWGNPLLICVVSQARMKALKKAKPFGIAFS